MKKCIVLLLCMLAAYSTLYAQASQKPLALQVVSKPANRQTRSASVIRPLRPGDPVPEVVLSTMVNYPKKTLRLSDLRGKAVLLDFWATWCSLCLDGLVKMERFQKKFEDRLQVISVNAQQTGDDLKKIGVVLERYHARTGYTMRLPYSVGDTVLQKLFVHKYLPQVVWIDASGKFVATTWSLDVTDDEVTALIDRKPLHVQKKKDSISFNQDTPYFSSASDSVVRYSSAFTRYIDGPGQGGALLTDSSGSKWSVTNYPLSYFYVAAHPFFPDLASASSNRLRFNLPLGHPFPGMYLARNRMADLYCYQLRVPYPITGDEAVRIMHDELQKAFGVQVNVVSDSATVLVFKDSADLLPYRTKGGYSSVHFEDWYDSCFIRNEPASTLLSCIDFYSGVPIIDETGMTSLVDFDFPPGFKHFTAAECKKFLQDRGLHPIEEKRKVKLVVFTPYP